MLGRRGRQVDKSFFGSFFSKKELLAFLASLPANKIRVH
jgi:hypothetical protein